MDARSLRDQTIRDAKCNLILDAARKVFAEKGFHESRLEDIAAESGFSKASLYNYFNDKDEIFLNLAVRDFENLLNTLISITSSSEPFFINLEKLIRTSLAFFGDQSSFIISITNFHVIRKLNPERLVQHHKIISEKFSKQYHAITAFYTKLIEEAQKRGELITTLPAAVITRYITTLIRGVFIEWKMKGEKGDPERETQYLLTFIKNGIGKTNTGSTLTESPVEQQ
jgi:AcrR family transcriptional regulator